MAKNYRELGKMAEDAVRSIRDKDLRREAFRILLLQFMAEGRITNGQSDKSGGRIQSGIDGKRKVGRPQLAARKKTDVHRPGRRGGGVATVAIQKLIDTGSFKAGRDAAGIMRELKRRHIRLEPSQLRMVLLRFSRAGKLKRRVKMKGQKVTYLYSLR